MSNYYKKTVQVCTYCGSIIDSDSSQDTVTDPEFSEEEDSDYEEDQEFRKPTLKRTRSFLENNRTSKNTSFPTTQKVD